MKNEQNLIIDIVSNEPISSSEDIAKIISLCVQKTIDELLIKINKNNITVNINLQEPVSDLIRKYSQRCAEQSANLFSLKFAEYIIDNNITDKCQLENIYKDLFEGKVIVN